MKKLTVAALALAAMTTSAFAQGAQTNCAKSYKDFWEKLMRESAAKFNGEELSGISRQALRAYDSCLAGDQLEASKFFEALSRNAAAKKG
jgi:hypothetical protein